MKNPIGHPLPLEPLINDNVKYGWRVTDDVNQVHYDITEEPWATICATAYANSGREPAFADVEVVFEGGTNAQNKSYIKNYDILQAAGLVFTNVDDLMNYLYSVDFHGKNLTIDFCGEIPDMWLYTDRLVSCGRVYLWFAGEDTSLGAGSDSATNLTAANACISKCCGIRIYGPITTYVDGSIRVQYDAKGMPDLFYMENSYVHFRNLQILVDRCSDANGWKGAESVSYPALFCAGMNSKIEFNQRFILCFGGGGNVTTRTWPFYVLICINYAYALFSAQSEITIRHTATDKLWTFSDKPPFFAGRFAMIRMSNETGGGYSGVFKLGDGVVGCQANINGYIDAQDRMKTLLKNMGLNTFKETTQGQVRVT